MKTLLWVCWQKTEWCLKQRSLTPLTLQEESGLKLALYGCDGGARSKRASTLTLSLVSRLVGGEILKKGVDQPFSHFIIPFY
ncbi:hypothetical protein [Helicobacter pylori]|uniref:hypothetical protein n=1 Tax=Helicobacter pylori TaxID=210 RepID=UPI0015D8BF5B|nr:hypothetical protein [Helicobacter pylori]